MRQVAILALMLLGCGGDNTSPPDMAAPDMAVTSNCGHPGDVGNSLGVGKYCTAPTFIADCSSNTKAKLCANLGAKDEFFCTFVCDGPDAGAECGENAICACGSGSSQSGCGCFPTSCL